MSATPDAEFLTTCQSPTGRRIGAKHWPPGAALPTPVLSMEGLLTFKRQPVGSFDELADVLDELTAEPSRFLVRGDLIQPSDKPIPRWLADRAEGPATLRDAAKHQLFLDVEPPADSFPEPHGKLDEAYAADVWRRIGMLVDEFEDRECWWMFTASAGTKPQVRLRIAVWLAEPVTCEQARGWCKTLNARVGFQLFDPSVFSGNQPNYIAAPVLNGRSDPCVQRFGRIEGRACGALSLAAETRLTGQSIAAPMVGFIPTGDADPLPRAAEAFLARLAPGYFQSVIRAAVAAAVASGASSEAIIHRILDCVAERGDKERVRHWSADLPRLVRWTQEQEKAKQARADAMALPHPGLDGLLPVPQARVSMKQAIRKWKREAIEALKSQAQWQADTLLMSNGESAQGLPLETPVMPRTLLNVGVGLGKTVDALSVIKELLDEGHIKRATFLVPTHKLGAELVNKAVEKGIDARVWYGVEAIGADGQPVCSEPEISKAANAVHALKDVCKQCPARKGCAYLAQKKKNPQLWIATHDFLTTPPPSTMKNVQALIIDEGFTKKGLKGTEGKPLRLLTSTLEGDLSPLPREDHTELRELRFDLKTALESVGQGEYLTKEALEGQLTWARIDRAFKLEWQRKPDVRKALKGVEKTPPAIVATLKKIKERPFNTMLPQLWSDALELMEGRHARVICNVQVDAGETGTGSGVELGWRKDIHSSWMEMPVLMLDATADRSMVEARMGTVEWVEVQAELDPSVRVVQVIDQQASKKWMLGDEGDTGRIKKLLAMIKVQKARCRKMLVITQLDVETALKENGLPAGVLTAHFNAIEGRDEFKDVDTLIVAGCTQATTVDVERIAEVLFGRRVTPVGAAWPKHPVRLTGRTKSVVVEVPRHPDPGAESVRGSICEAGIVQAIGRARAVNRDASTPLTIFVIGNTPVPTIQPDELVTWADLVPSRLEVFAAENRILPMDPRALVAAGVFRTVDAAKSALKEARAEIKWVNCLIDTPNKGFHPLSTQYAYRRPGQRGSASTCYGPEDSNLARTRLEALIGAVVAWERVVDAAEDLAACAAPVLTEVRTTNGLTVRAPSSSRRGESQPPPPQTQPEGQISEQFTESWSVAVPGGAGAGSQQRPARPGNRPVAPSSAWQRHTGQDAPVSGAGRAVWLRPRDGDH